MSDGPAHFPLRVRDIVAETADACSIVFEPAEEHRARFGYKPGQFLTLRLNGPSGSVGRCYSLASSPHEGDELRIAVKRVRDGYGSNWICDTLAVGDVVDSLPPAGVFTPRTFDEDLLLWAGGSGITPIMSILRSALHPSSGGARRVVLFYANQDQDSVIFAAPLRELAAANPGRLTVVHWLETVQGLPTREQLQGFAAPFASYTSFICGPGPFMDAVTHALKALDVPRARIHVELFQSLAENPFDMVGPAPAADSSQPSSVVEVELDGETHILDWPAQTKLLDLMLERGLDAPFSCRQGACSACACRLTSGEVKMLHNDILDQSDLDEGYVLACQAVPVSDSVKITYT